MASSMGQGRIFWMACTVVALCGALLGLRSERAVSAVLAGPRLDVLSVDARPGRLGDRDQLASKDSLLAASVPAERDPFCDPPPPPRPARKASPPKPKPIVVPKPPAPHLQALLYDLVDPAVQLRVSGRTSAWLPVGAEHEGWRILDITARSVVVTHSQGDTLTLP